MQLSECSIGTLVFDKDYPVFVGHIIDTAWNGFETIVVVQWPEISKYHLSLIREERQYSACTWIQFDERIHAIHPGQLVKA
jgi:hypothetical protein